MKKSPTLPNSIAFWIPVGATMVFVTSIILSSGILYFGSKQVSKENNLSQISHLLQFLKARAERYIQDNDIGILRDDISFIKTIPNVTEVAIIDGDDNIVVANDFSVHHKSSEKLVFLKTENFTRNARQLRGVNYLQSDDENTIQAFLHLTFPSPTEPNSKKQGTVFIRYDLNHDQLRFSDYISAKLLILVLAGISVLALTIYAITQYLLNPFKQLIFHAEALSKGAYKKKLDVTGPTEIHSLALAFDKIRLAISFQISELKSSNERLEASVKLRVLELGNVNIKYQQAQRMGKLGHWEIDLVSLRCSFSEETYDILGVKRTAKAEAHLLFKDENPNDSPLSSRLACLLDLKTTAHDLDYQITVNHQPRYIRLVAQQMPSSSKQEKTLVGIIQDITEQKLKELSLVETEAKTRAILDTAADAIVVINAYGQIQEFSPAACKIFGYIKQEALGKNVNMLMPNANASQHDGYLEKYHQTGQKNIIGTKRELVAKRKSGEEFPIDLSVAETQIGGTQYYTAIIRDITSHKTSEKTLRKAMETAQQATQAKSVFLANMSHEIRTPMNAIIGLAHIALADSPSPRQKQFLEKISHSALNLLGILNDILDISKIEAGKLNIERVPFRLEDVVEHVTDVILVKAEEKDINFIIDVDSDTPTALIGDPLRIAQVIINLCSNAIKFTSSLGEIVWLIKVDKQQTNEVTLSFSVSDNGIGIPEDKQKQLFEAFTQADTSTTREYGGTGLGLTISKSLVSKMKGTIGFDSQEGKGSCFYFQVTLAIQSGEISPILGGLHQQTKLPKAQVNKLKGIKVLLVEDNEINQEIAVKLLIDVGIKTVTADNGAEAIERLGNEIFDLILMDCQMPIMDGYTATKKIRRLSDQSDIPIIALTANVMQQDIVKIIDSGMNDYIAKPLDIDLLYHKIFKYLASIEEVNTSNSEEHQECYQQLSFNLDPTIVDMEQALKQVSNDIEFYKKMVAKFRIGQADFSTSIRKLLVTNELKSAEIQAHTLKGQASYLGFVQVAKAANQLEQTLTNNKATRDKVEGLLETIEQLTQRALTALDDVWKNN